ncbi:hypothetical protein ACIA3Y_04825 [Lactobacillus delbrueckii subsp. bulgaricus]
MASYGNTVLTSAGIDLVQRVIANTATFEITKVATSSDSRLTNATINTIEALTAMPSVQQTGKVTAFDTSSSSKQVGLKCEFTNQGLTNQYDICGVGIYAKEAGKSEILFAVAPAEDPEKMPAKPNDQSALFTFSLNMYVVVGQASAMSITATTEGVVKSINGSLTPNVNGDVTIDDSSHAKFIEAELIHGHLLVPLVDDSGNPVTDPAGNQFVADEYLPKSIKLGDNQEIFPGTDNTVRLPVYTQAEVDAKLSAKADTTSVTTKDDALQSQIDGNTSHLDSVDSTLSQHTKQITGNADHLASVDSTLGKHAKQIADNTSHLGDIDDTLGKHAKKITDNADHLGNVDDTLGKHTKQISQATGEASYALDQISTGLVATALSDGQGGYLTDERGNTLMSETRAVTSVNGKIPAADGSITIDDYYTKQAIDNRLEVKADLLQMEDEHSALQSQIRELRSLVYELRHDVDQLAMTRLTITPRRLPTTPTT